MSAFQLDTSGLVTIPLGTPQPGDHKAFWAWSDLSPFEQGYVEALFASINGDAQAEGFKGYGFSDLHPDTLSAIRKDCGVAGWGYQDRADLGREVWAARQRGEYADRPHPFPPQVPFLDDEGRVCLREAGE